MTSPTDDAGRLPVEAVSRGSWLALWHPGRPSWYRLSASIAGLHPALAGLRIIHLSDLHLRADWCRTYDLLIERVNAANPDLILFTGDFVDCKYDHRIGLPTLKRFFTALKSRLGIFGILGNHDGDLLGPELADCNVRWLDQQKCVLEHNEAVMELIGLPGVHRGDLDGSMLASFASAKPAGSVRIVLSHYPDFFPYAESLQPDLFLTGHTHGGQVCLPFGIPLIVHDSSPRWRTRGIHRIGPTWFIANRGIGFSTYRVRLFCPSEVVEIVLA